MTNNTVKGTKKSAFTGSTTIPSGAYLDFVVNGQNLRILDTDFYAALGVTGSLVQDGDPSGTPVLDVQGSVNAIRNITPGFGISSTINAQNGITFATDFSFDQTGATLVDDVAASAASFRSLVSGDGVTITTATGQITITADVAASVIIVKTGSQLAGTILSNKIYFIDGVIDMTGLGTISVPAGGISIVGNDFDISQLISSTPGHVMFTGTGSVKARDVAFSVTGTTSSVYSLVGATGNEFIELTRVNYNDCVSLGEIDNYRQGLELETGRFGGNPSLILSGAWDGYRITTSIISNMDNAIATPLFKFGTALVFAARFVTDINADLGTLAAFSDFSDSNFSMSSSFKIADALFRRNGVVNSDDATINTGMDADNLSSNWTGNNGIHNTFEGGRLDITASSATALSGVAIGAFLDLAGTYTASDLQHFDSPSNGQIRHLGIDPREYSFFGDITIDGTAGDIITLKVVKWDNSASGFVDVMSLTREVFNFTGGSDAGFFILKNAVTLDENDYMKLQVANTTAARNVTAEVADYLIVEAR
jgi:hypothetical protein